MPAVRAPTAQSNATTKKIRQSPVDIPVPDGPETNDPPASDSGRKVCHRDRLREDQPAEEQDGEDARAPGWVPKYRRRNTPSGEDSRVECPECGMAWPIRARPRDVRCPGCACFVHEFMGMQDRTPSPSDRDARGPSTPHKRRATSEGHDTDDSPGSGPGQPQHLDGDAQSSVPTPPRASQRP